ncbi:PASTA domain-containing protein [Amycolatopsis anabasis]|uniref:PASTA domain-containing protein n=1 Tax=Amycolatopsis anabasis TaxID=1840409 RepID=UPI001FE9E63A|nr:PASTA domain-containing protein [Amycolatopsis anabasis]
MRRTAGILVSTVLVAGCGGGSATPSITGRPYAPPPEPAAEATVSPEPAGIATMPNVVGMNHQQAQDTLRTAGFRYLSEEDATGQGRPLLDDRNWIVVRQAPESGIPVSQSARILLRAKKYTDSGEP